MAQGRGKASRAAITEGVAEAGPPLRIIERDGGYRLEVVDDEEPVGVRQWRERVVGAERACANTPAARPHEPVENPEPLGNISSTAHEGIDVRRELVAPSSPEREGASVDLYTEVALDLLPRLDKTDEVDRPMPERSRAGARAPGARRRPDANTTRRAPQARGAGQRSGPGDRGGHRHF